MKSADIREKFLSFFEEQGHKRLPSSSLIPHEDPTLLFNNAGMNQFKNVFLGVEKPPGNRATTAQKCVRAGGKHNDLDNVGFTARHHTFFEMMGNFSFGDYFKREAIKLAWKFLTEELKLSKEKLYVTAFHDDSEAKDIWIQEIGVPEDHFKTFGEKDNFWRMGDTGPCGPCSEIFYDLGPEMGDGPEDVLGGEGDRYVEIWNLVFMQFEEKEDGSQEPLKNPSIDTGMGLERMAMVLQKTKSNYETDLFLPIIEEAAKLTKLSYTPEDKNTYYQTAALRVLADHARSVSFLIADGVLPSNEGRGYVLRRILRRAVRFNKKLEADPIFSTLCESVIEKMKPFYPELEERKKVILNHVREEEAKFLETLEHGEKLLEKEIQTLKKNKQNVLDGKTAFKLYDTFGFPIDLTAIILKEEGLEVDEKAFDEAIENAKELSRSNASSDSEKVGPPDSIKEALQEVSATDFLGYEKLTTEAKALKVFEGEDSAKDYIFVIFDQTPFYAEGGGQISDQGLLQNNDTDGEVLDVQKMDHLFVHTCKLKNGHLKEGDSVTLTVHRARREAIQRNHSATHLLHAALIQHCGEEVQQAGSLVNEHRLRFDFNHKGPVGRDRLKKIEEDVNQEIQKATHSRTQMMNIDEAKKSGAKALFGEKYDSEVRVLTLGDKDFSIELCGGTHVSNTQDIMCFKIINETGVSSGVRRIEALTGFKALSYLNTRVGHLEETLESLKLPLNAKSEDVLRSFEKVQEENKSLKKKLHQQKNSDLNDIQATKLSLKSGEVDFLCHFDESLERKDLREAADKLRDKNLKQGFCVLVGQPSEKGAPVVVTKTKNLKDYHAGDILKTLASEFGGKGGGREDFAQGSFTSFDKSQTEKVQKIVETL